MGINKIIADYHLHTDFSSDSSAKPEDMIKGCISRGLTHISITDHYDMECYDYEVSKFEIPEYFRALMPLKEKYKDKININIGIEVGIQPDYANFLKVLVKDNPFDFVIGSTHEIKKRDPSFGYIFENSSDKDVYRMYFEQIYENILSFDNFHVLGHMDYVVRYGKQQDLSYKYDDYAEIIDKILRTIIHKGIGLEVNTAGLKYGLPFPHPHMEILKKYNELGGEILTIGSDAHSPQHIAYDFDKVSQYIRAAGFEKYTIFSEGKPVFYELR